MLRLRKMAGGIYLVSTRQFAEMIATECDGGDETQFGLLGAVAHYVSTDPPFNCRICQRHMSSDDVVFIVICPSGQTKTFTTHICASCSRRNDLPKYLEDAARDLFPGLSVALH